MNLFPNWQKNLLFLVVYIFSGAALVIIVDGLQTGTELTPFNTTIESAILTIRTPGLTRFFLDITNWGNPVVLGFLAVFAAILLLLKRETYDAMLYIVSMTLSYASFFIMKNLFQFTRPGTVLTDISGWSFPSGHATIATAFFFATAYSFFDWPRRPIMKTLLVAACAAGAALISFSRLYLGAHWSLDILAGVALGLLTVSFTALVFNIFIERDDFLRIRKKSVIQ